MKYKNLVLIGILQLCIIPPLFGQLSKVLNAVDFDVHYNSGLFLKSEVTQVVGYGYSGALDFPLGNSFEMSLAAGYFKNTVNQDSAVKNWGWDFWEEFYSIRVENFQETYDVSQSTSQELLLYPVTLSVVFQPKWNENVQPYIEGGLGVVAFKRSLWLDETWGKEYQLASGEKYYYDYNFDTYAVPKEGRLFVADVGTGVNIFFWEKFATRMNIRYVSYPDLSGMLGDNYSVHYDRFPARSSLMFSLGIKISY